MSKFYQTKKFKQLNKEWASKLKDSGFRDIEPNEDTLAPYSTRFLRHPHYVWELRLAYYSMCEAFLQKYTFKSEYEKVIWEYHANGLSEREIAKVLPPIKGKKRHYSTIWNVISDLRAIMKQTYLADEDDEYSN